MERRLIRQRWQITIPGRIRRELNLYLGQLLNFDLVEQDGEVFIRMFTGSVVDPEERAAFQEVFARKKGKGKRVKCAGKIRKSEAQRESRALRLVDLRKGLEPSTATELKEIISNLSAYLLSLQARLSGWEGTF
jgi:bifunctional DNA-binding transcriptional regulator/antitoxin component of YhaV-PrlF toxin-antitoxin module